MSRSTLKISIVVPSYQQAEFLERCLRSILEQPYSAVECIVRDGGSTDGSVPILRRMEREFPQKLQWVSQKDRGQTDALNAGFRVATGDILAYLNSDDEYIPGMFPMIVEEFRRNSSLQWLTGECEIIDVEGHRIQRLVQFYKRIWRNFQKREVLSVLNPIAQPATFWRRSAYQKVGSFEEHLRYCMDYDFWLRLWNVYGAPRILPVSLARFRIHHASKGGSQYEMQFAEELAVAKRHHATPFAMALHRLHNSLIVGLYKILK